MFDLHPRLIDDAYDLGYFPLCRLLLSRDACYPWFFLVPQVESVSEIYELSQSDQAQFLHESSLLASLLKERFKADKINIAALGNIVPQLHVHHIVRYAVDPSWPAPIWGVVPATAYTSESLDKLLNVLNAANIPNFNLVFSVP